MKYFLIGLAHRKTGLSPPVKLLYRPFQGGTSFVDHLCYICLFFVMLSCLVVTYRDRADLLALARDV